MVVIADMTWHLLFGIEANVEALLSPTHLILALGMTLILTGPLRAAWRRADEAVGMWTAQWPMLLSLTFMFSMLTFFTQYAHPFGWTFAANANRSTGDLAFYNQALGIMSILVQTAILMGLVLF